MYFNRNDDGFQNDGLGKYDDGKGWDFVRNPFPDGVGVKGQISTFDKRQINYVDYRNEAHVFSLNQLKIRPKWYDFLDPFGIFGLGFYNAAQYNKKKE